MSFLVHSRVVWRGTIATAEEWSTSLAFRSTGTPTQSGLQALADGARTALSAWFAAGAGAGEFFSTAVTFQRVDAYAIDTTGTTFGQAEAVVSSPPAGVQSPARSPQDAIVASMRTGFPGRRFRGRQYWPLLGVGIGSDLRISTGQRDLIGGQVVDLIDSMNLIENEVGDPFTAVVASGVGAGLLTTIDSVVIGRVIDTQRRRRNSLDEAPASFAVA